MGACKTELCANNRICVNTRSSLFTGFMIRTSSVAKVSVVLVSMAIATFASATAHAVSLTFDTQFFDSTGSVVGSGAFTYETNQPVTIALSPPGTTVTVNNLLSSFSATLPNATWQMNRALWVEAGGTQGLLLSRPATVGVQNAWEFGDNSLGNRVFVMKGQQNQAGVFTGTWLQSLINIQPNPFSGSWTATQRSEAVPEPTTMAGMALAAIVGAWARRQRQSIRH